MKKRVLAYLLVINFCSQLFSIDQSHQDLISKVRQPWQFIAEYNDAVLQIFSQVAEVNLLEPFKTPAQFAARGTGFFIEFNNEKVIVTNAHVIDQAMVIWVRIPSFGKELFNAEVIGVCPERDLAILRLKKDDYNYVLQHRKTIASLPLGNSDSVYRADEVLALGYPLGQESLKGTTGVVSGHEQGLIQTSAALNPGNSGGPLLNLNGHVVGINTRGFKNAQNIGYAIPANELKVILADLFSVLLLRKPFLGILSMNATPSLVDYLGNPQPGGCFIIEVIENSPLFKAGLKHGDMIYAINDHRLDMYGDMNIDWAQDKISIVDYVARLQTGDKVELLVYRQGQPLTVTVQFDQSEVLPIRNIYPAYEPVDYEIFAGMVVMELTLNHVAYLAKQAPGLARYTEMKNQTEPAVIITQIFPSELQRSRTLMPGIVLKKVNGIPVKTLADFRKAIQQPEQGKYLTITAYDTITKASDNMFVVLPHHKIIQEMLQLARDFRFPLSDTVQRLISSSL